MNILFLGDIVGNSGCSAVKKFLPNIIKSKKINFVIVNGENAAKEGVGITENIVNELLSCGVDVITTGNHVWDQKETFEFIKNQKRLLNIRQRETTSWNNPNMVKYKKTHKFGSRKKPDGTYEYKQKNKFPNFTIYQNPIGYHSKRGIINPKSTSQSKPYYDPISRKKFTGINLPERIPPKVKKKLDTLDNLQGNMDFQVQRTPVSYTHLTLPTSDLV